jgi:hypothetical protein
MNQKTPITNAKSHFNRDQKFYFSVKEIDFTSEFIDYEQFLLQEFFSADTETKIKISRYYIENYGEKAYNYLKIKYLKWAKGDFHLTDLMKNRILIIMPLFLGEEAKNKLAVHEFMAAIKRTIKMLEHDRKNRFKNTLIIKDPKDILSIFEREYEKIKEVEIQKHLFDLLTEEEWLEAEEITKYILEIKLQNYFNQIESDLKVFLPLMEKMSKGFFYAEYTINYANIKLELTNNNKLIVMPGFNIPEIITNSRFKAIADKYLAFEMVSIIGKVKTGNYNSYLSTMDIELFIQQYKILLDSKKLVDMKSTLQGAGGTLFLSLKVESIINLVRPLSGSLIVFLFYLGAACVIIYLPITSFKNNNDWFSVIFICGFSLLILIFAIIQPLIVEFKEIRSLIKKIKSHGI